MRKFGVLAAAFALVCMLGASASAHVGVTVFYPQVPDPAAITIDGNDDDWGWYDPALALKRQHQVIEEALPHHQSIDLKEIVIRETRRHLLPRREGAIWL